MAFVSLTKSLQLTSVVYVNALNATQATLAALAGVLIFKEALSPWLAIGVGLTIGGLMLLAWAHQAMRRTHTTPGAVGKRPRCGRERFSRTRSAAERRGGRSLHARTPALLRLNPNIPPVVELQLNKLVADALVKLKPGAAGRVAVAERHRARRTGGEPVVDDSAYQWVSAWWCSFRCIYRKGSCVWLKAQ